MKCMGYGKSTVIIFFLAGKIFITVLVLKRQESPVVMVEVCVSERVKGKARRELYKIKRIENRYI